MPHVLRIMSLGVLILCACATAPAAQRDNDEVVDLFVRAWNAHDAAPFSDVLAEDADWVTASGLRLKGRADILAFLNKEQAGWAKSTTMTKGHVAVRALGPDAAVLHLSWEITGIVSRDGKPAPASRGTNIFVAEKQSSGWKVVAGQVTLEKAEPE